jgi:hypothetical protein
MAGIIRSGEVHDPAVLNLETLQRKIEAQELPMAAEYKPC